MFKLKRAYEKPSRDDGSRILVERLWPRGLTKERAAVDLWLKEVAPSPELRKWFGHDRLGAGGRRPETDRRAGAVPPREPQRALARLILFPGPGNTARVPGG